MTKPTDIRIGQIWRNKTTGTEYEVTAVDAKPSDSILSPLGLTLSGGWELGDMQRALIRALEYLDKRAAGIPSAVSLRTRDGVESGMAADELIATCVCRVMGWAAPVEPASSGD